MECVQAFNPPEALTIVGNARHAGLLLSNEGDLVHTELQAGHALFLSRSEGRQVLSWEKGTLWTYGRPTTSSSALFAPSCPRSMDGASVICFFGALLFESHVAVSGCASQQGWRRVHSLPCDSALQQRSCPSSTGVHTAFIVCRDSTLWLKWSGREWGGAEGPSAPTAPS